MKPQVILNKDENEEENDSSCKSKHNVQEDGRKDGEKDVQEDGNNHEESDSQFGGKCSRGIEVLRGQTFMYFKILHISVRTTQLLRELHL